MPVVTQDELEYFGQVDITGNPPGDAAFAQYIASAQAVAERYCNRLFDRATGYAETLDGKRSTVLRLKLLPVEAITSVVEDGDTLTEGDDFQWYPNGLLVRTVQGDSGRSIPWTHKRQAVVVTYTGGYATGEANVPPEDLKWAVANIALRLYKSEAAWASTPAGASGGLTAVALDGVGSASFGASAAAGGQLQGGQLAGGSGPGLTPAEKAALAPYRRRRIAGAWRPEGVF